MFPLRWSKGWRICPMGRDWGS